MSKPTLQTRNFPTHRICAIESIKTHLLNINTLLKEDLTYFITQCSSTFTSYNFHKSKEFFTNLVSICVGVSYKNCQFSSICEALSARSVVSSARRLKYEAAARRLRNSSSRWSLRHFKNSSVDVVDTYIALLLLSHKWFAMYSSPKYFRNSMTSQKISLTAHFFCTRKYVVLRNFFMILRFRFFNFRSVVCAPLCACLYMLPLHNITSTSCRLLMASKCFFYAEWSVKSHRGCSFSFTPLNLQ